MTAHIASSFDKNYLLRAVAMHASLSSALPDAVFWFLCLDHESEELITKLALPNVTCITLEEMGDKELLATRAARNNTEFAMTSKSTFLSYLIRTEKVKEDDLLTLTDVDIIFYPAVRDYIEKVKQDVAHSIFVTPHNFPPEKEALIPEVGYYNGGFISFRINKISAACIHAWRAQCINWCYLWHDYEHGWHTDQMYLDAWKNDYAGVLDVPDKGVNVGTWNIERYAVTKAADGSLLIDGDPLVCYHFHGLKMYLGRSGRIRPYPICVYNDIIYYDYMRALEHARTRILEADPSWDSYGLAARPGLLRWMKQALMRRLQRKR